MPALTYHEARREPWRYVVRGVVTLAVALGVAFWLLFASYLAAFRCDEGCSGDQAESWQYEGQAYLALAGAALTAVAMVLGFTPYTRAYRVFVTLAIGSAVVWVGWLRPAHSEATHTRRPVRNFLTGQRVQSAFRRLAALRRLRQLSRR